MPLAASKLPSADGGGGVGGRTAISAPIAHRASTGSRRLPVQTMVEPPPISWRDAQT